MAIRLTTTPKPVSGPKVAMAQPLTAGSEEELR